jgi:ABC-type transport system substrate-binding protein
MRVSHTCLLVLLSLIVIAITAGLIVKAGGNMPYATTTNELVPPGSCIPPASSHTELPGVKPDSGSEGDCFDETFRIGVFRDPITLDPALATNEASLMVCRNVFSGLFKYGEDGSLVRDLADSWEVSDDGLTYTFHLKTEASFHDGSGVKAQDFVYSINRALLHPLRTALAEDYLGSIVGAREAMHEKASNVSGITAPNDYTLVVKVTCPQGSFPYVFAEPVTFAIRRKSPSDGTNEGFVGLRQEDLAGSGPYKVTTWEKGDRLVLEVFEDYYGSLPAARRVEMLTSIDYAQGLSMYENGHLDVCEVLPEYVDRVMQSTAVRGDLAQLPGGEVYLLGLNPSAHQAFKDPAVRRAVSCAIDRDALVERVLGGKRFPLFTIIPPGVDGYSPSQVASCDLEAARKLLTHVGHTEPGKGLRIYTADSERAGKVARFVASSLNDKLGIESSVMQMGFGELLEAIEEGIPEAFLLGWVPGRRDPYSFMGHLCNSKSPYNYARYKNDAVDEFLECAACEADSSARTRYYQYADRIVVADALWIPLYCDKRFVLVRQCKQGVLRDVLSDCSFAFNYPVKTRGQAPR